MTGSALRVPIDGLAEGAAALPEEAARYVTRVHRVGPGGAFVGFDPARGLEADVEVVAVDRRRAEVRVGPLRPAAVRATRGLVLLQGLGKGDKMDAIVRDATELGATRVVPVLAARSVARPADGEARARRWRRIAVEAARQSGRGDAPTVDEPTPLDDALATLGGAGRFAGVCLDPASRAPLARALGDLAGADAAVILVGPEGGLEEAELAAAERAGLARVSLGGFVLRTETVCAAVLGALLVARGA